MTKLEQCRSCIFARISMEKVICRANGDTEHKKTTLNRARNCELYDNEIVIDPEMSFEEMQDRQFNSPHFAYGGPILGNHASTISMDELIGNLDEIIDWSKAITKKYKR